MRTTFTIIPLQRRVAVGADFTTLDPDCRKTPWLHLRCDFTLHDGQPISSLFFDMEGLPYALPPEYRKAVYAHLTNYARAHHHANP